MKLLPDRTKVQIHTYAELQEQIHDDLRIQHPEWVEPNGESTMCDSYEARLKELLDHLTAEDPLPKCRIIRRNSRHAAS
jgi:hypothetical protein